MSQEVRTIRPFVGLEAIGQVFANAVLSFGDIECEADSTVYVEVDPHQFLLRSLVLRWVRHAPLDVFCGQLRQACEQLGADERDLSILIVATTSYLKKADILFELPVAELAGLAPTVALVDGDRPPALRCPHHGFTIEAYLVLMRDLPRRPLSPWRKGTWIARPQFNVLTESIRSLFTPAPLDSETRQRLGLPPKTVRYVDFGDHDPLEPLGEQAEKPVLYVDDDLLAELSASARSPTGIALQIQLAHDFMTAVVYEAARRKELEFLTVEDLEGTLLGRILLMAAGPNAGRSELGHLLSWVRSQPARVVARIEHIADVRKPFLAAIHGERSAQERET